MTSRRPIPLITTIVLALAASGAAAQEAKQVEPLPAPRKPIELTISPAAAPTPALRYRLFPLESERTPGDAAPIYLRIRHETRDELMKLISDKAVGWIELPIDQLPLEAVRDFVRTFSTKTSQIEFGARRQTCNWNYTIPEQREHVIEILLPDAQEMRAWGRVLAVKARLEIAEKRYDDAIRTIETGLAFARHVGGDGPFLINSLVGIAIANVMLAQLADLIAQPDAPSLYWALTALPRPLISLRAGMEVEQRIVENLVPELRDLKQQRTEAEWSALLVRLHARLVDLARRNSFYQNAPTTEVAGMKAMSLEGLKAELLPKARSYLQSQHQFTEAEIRKLSDDQAVVLSIAARYRDLRDSWFKYSYLTYNEALSYLPKVDEPGKGNALQTTAAAIAGFPIETKLEASRKAAQAADAPTRVFAAIMPSISGGMRAEVLLERRIAALRVVEAIRLHAAEHGGRLPESLDAVSATVPVPVDPATGKAFSYSREGGSGRLSAPMLQKDVPAFGIDYRLTLRK